MRQVRLGDFLEVQAGFAFKTEFFTSGDGLPLIRIRDLAKSKTEINYSGPYKPDFLVNNGDYLIGMDGNFRCHRWQGGPSLLNQRVCRVRNFREDIEPDYVYYGIQRKLQDIEDTTPFVTVKHLSATQVQNVEMPLPPLPEQRRIVDLLCRAEGIVRLRREAEKKAAELIPALFNDMFGDPATNPKGWPVSTLGDAIESADYGSSTKASDDGSGVPLIRMGNVSYEGTLNLFALKFVNLPPKEVEKYRLQQGDILFNRTNSKDLVGKTGLWNDSREAIAASYFIRLRAHPDKLHPCYLWVFMNSKYMKRILFDTARGAIGQANINSKELKAFKIALPPLDLQVSFAAKMDQITSIQAQQSTATAKAQATFDALLDRCFAPTAAVEGGSSD